MLQLILVAGRLKCVTAVTMKEALQLAASQEFDLYVLDRHLPDGSGLELCQKLSKITPGVACILYSGDAYAIHKAEAFAAGADAYVVKPDIDRLIESVRQQLVGRECAEANYVFFFPNLAFLDSAQVD